MIAESFLGKIVFDKIVLDAADVSIGKDALPVDDAIADRSHAFFDRFHVEISELIRSDLWQHFHVFYVNEWKAARVFLEVSNRVLTGHADPAEIQFHFDVVLVGRFQQ